MKREREMKAAEEMKREELNTPKMLRRVRLDLNTPAEMAIFKAMQEVEKAGADVRLTEATMLLAKAKDCVADFIDGVEQSIPPAEGAENIRQLLLGWEHYKRDHFRESEALDVEAILLSEYSQIAAQPQPTAEGAEEILASLVESLGEPDNSVTDHSYEIRPLTVEGKREWWMFHNGVGSGEPLAQWLSKFATLHAQKIADKMVEEKLKEELIAYDKWVGEKYIDNYRHETAPAIVDEYLKSRER